MRIEPITARKGGWKEELINLFFTAAFLLLSTGMTSFYVSSRGHLFAQFVYAGETVGTVTHARKDMYSQHRKLEIEYVNDEGKTRGFWIEANTEKDVGDRVKVRYCREGGETVVETLPDLIVHVILVILLFVFNLFLSCALLTFILWYYRRVCIVIRRWEIRLKRKFRRKHTSEGKRT